MGRISKTLLKERRCFQRRDAYKVAWSAVKKVYENDSKGNWQKRRNNHNFRFAVYIIAF
jgi:hypothetical protein